MLTLVVFLTLLFVVVLIVGVILLIQHQKINLLTLELKNQNNSLGDPENLRKIFYETSSYVSNQAVVQAMDRANNVLLEQANQSVAQATGSLKELVEPITQKLEQLANLAGRLDSQLLEKYSVLTEQLRSLKESEAKLEKQADNLISALKNPQSRGRWGEIQLKRVVELAGMLSYCDFVEQQVLQDSDSRLRPDMIVKLPNKNQVVVDAKVPMDAYLRYIQADDHETAQEALKEHCKQLRNHIQNLGSKNYWDSLGPTEFVVAFISPESALNVALENDIGLVDFAIEKKVLLAGPTNLVALLKAIHYGWRQDTMYENAKEIIKVGSELHQRLLIFVNKFKEIGHSLEKTVDSYNSAVGSFESRLMPQAKRFESLGVGEKEIENLNKINQNLRSLNPSE